VATPRLQGIRPAKRYPKIGEKQAVDGVESYQERLFTRIGIGACVHANQKPRAAKKDVDDPTDPISEVERG